MSVEAVRRRPWLLWLPALAVMAGIFLLSHQSGLRVTEDVDVERPLRVSGHLLAYAALGGLLLLAVARLDPPRPGQAVLAWVLAVAYGLTDEFHQSFVPDRNGRLDDVVTDAIGAAVGVVVAWLVLSALARARETAAQRSAVDRS
jgi:VanZ family protein